MRGYKRDKKWGTVPASDRKPAEKSIVTPGAVELQSIPSETDLAVIALLMRIYDLQLANLNAVDPDRANEIYEAHEKGEHFNPMLFIPQMVPNEPVGNEDNHEGN